MIYLRLFFEFFKTGLFAVGGGLATLPFLYEMGSKTGWFSAADVADMIAVSESTPGAIGINMATFAGYKTAGIAGGVCATLGLAAPSIIIILIVAKFLERFRDNKYVNRAFLGLRPASIAMITAAGLNVVKIAMVDLSAYSGIETIPQIFILKAWILAAVIVIISLKFKKLHPIVLIALSAAAGILFKF
ncbi:MAG: chromate transporter [Firmicutes bacterium]|nr:chromate transporter [Bacillota bacterium]